jgi:phosphoribosylaminoimidazole carboxylase
MKTLGILGGGQLGRMLALAAANLGVPVKILDKDGAAAPAAVAAHAIKGDSRSAVNVEIFAAGVDTLTVENEHVDAATLRMLEERYSADIQPSASTIALIQDKFTQKNHFTSTGVALGEYCDIPNEDALDLAAIAYGYPFMLKSKRLAYDGHGNYKVNNIAEHEIAAMKLGGFAHGLYAEKWQEFSKELAVIVVRSRTGEIRLYPVTETIQKNSICHVTETPALIPAAARAAAENLAMQAVASLHGAGVFGVEMFLLADGRVLLNEVAPRVHNSGHYTMNACVTSQFENHIRAVMGLPLGDTSLTSKHVIMLNILGEDDGAKGQQIADNLMQRAYATPGCNVHWYNKSVFKGRKVGHINIVGRSVQEARERLALLDASVVTRLTAVPPQVGIIMGSDSDLPTMQDAAIVLEKLGVTFEITFVSAHRTPDILVDYARSAHERGLQCIIAGAGGAAHLPGMVAAMTPLPVVGVPVLPSSGSPLGGLDALLSIVQMPKGVPVAAVAIDNATNAGLLAARILGSTDEVLGNKLIAHQVAMRDEVLHKKAVLAEEGWRDYKRPRLGPS